jgi:hypothetical protein
MTKDEAYEKYGLEFYALIEKEAEALYQEMVADNWSNSPHTRRAALFTVLDKRTSERDVWNAAWEAAQS